MAAATSFQSVTFKFKNVDVTCQSCRTIRDAAKCHNLKITDFVALEGIRIVNYEIDICNDLDLDIDISFINTQYESEQAFLDHIERSVADMLLVKVAAQTLESAQTLE